MHVGAGSLGTSSVWTTLLLNAAMLHKETVCVAWSQRAFCLCGATTAGGSGEAAGVLKEAATLIQHCRASGLRSTCIPGLLRLRATVVGDDSTDAKLQVWRLRRVHSCSADQIDADPLECHGASTPPAHAF
jgi:hypothetical protein